MCVMGVARGQDIQHADQGGIYPAVSPGPVTALAVGFHIRRIDEGGIPPPQPVHRVVKPGRALRVAGVGVKLVHFV